MSKKISRRNRRIRNLLLVISMMMVVAMASVGVTVAWLTDKTDAITNTFTASNIDIDLTESANQNLKMVPGNTIAKDTKVTVKAGSEACYLFVKLDESPNFNTYLTYNVAGGWTALEGVEGVYYREVEAVAADTAEDQLPSYEVIANQNLTVNAAVTQEDMTGTGFDAPTLTVTAYACQSANVSSAAAAWATINPTTSTTTPTTPEGTN